MEAKLIALKLILDELEIPDTIDTIDDRKRVQKAVYLGQLAGVQLGYRFGWYKKGPYSPDLTKDYYALEEAIGIGESDYKHVKLQNAVKSQLERVKPLLIVPSGVALEQEDWLELVASVHYLAKISKRDEQRTKAVLEDEKPQLVPYLDAARHQLLSVQML